MYEMAAANRTQLPLLQRRGGKRSSTPSSPIVERRSDERMVRVDTASATEWHSATPLDSPCIDIDMPSPTFEIPGLASADMDTPRKPVSGKMANTSSSQYHLNEDSGRSPYLSSPPSDLAFRDSPRTSHFESAQRTSPMVNAYRDGWEGQGWAETKGKGQERPGSGGRNMSAASIYTVDRSMQEDGSYRAPTMKKSRLNLLNPMSLLARRRSSQHGKLDDVNVSPLQVPAIPDFDPSIRGSIVHDFSAPRIRTPRREPESSAAQHRVSDHGTSQSHGPSSPALHSPMFKEHFQEDNHTTLQPGQTAYLHNQNLEAPSSETLPPFAKRLPTNLPSSNDTTIQPGTSKKSARDDGAPTPPPKTTPPFSSAIHDGVAPSGLPKHMKSTSSRFSFQMSGQGSDAQEQLLEERHRERFPHGQGRPDDMDGEDDYGDYDFDADDGLEEKIPGVNSDFAQYDDEFGTDDIQVQDINLQSSQQPAVHDDYDFGGDEGVLIQDVNSPTHDVPKDTAVSDKKKVNRLSLARFHFTPQSSTLSPISPGTGHGSEPTPRDSEGFPIGIADTKYSPSHMQLSHNTTNDEGDDKDSNFYKGLRISTGSTADHSIEISRVSNTFDDADLYFDDGEFGSEDINSDAPFNEDLLDDENHIRDIPAENEKKYKAAWNSHASESRVEPAAGEVLYGPASSETHSVQTLQLLTNSTLAQARPEQSQLSGLTEDNLAAYHDALANAANRAAANGRFDRQVSFSESSNAAEDAPWSSSPSGLVSDASRYSLNNGLGAYPDDEPFPFDDDNEYDDDLMIAEANAEALENDEDGFYGQEFGFYARAYGKEQPDLVNGGYFTSRGFSGLKRSHSGKANFQEPSLTPITERSEWSARNSVVSLGFHTGIGNAGQSLPSPGLNQLMDSPVVEDEMSLSALIKLRRGAFGGSSTSVNSMGERNVPSSSPLAQASGYRYPQADALTGRVISSNPSHHASASILESEEEDDEFGYTANNAAQITPRKATSDIAPRTPDQNSQQNKLDTPVTSRRSHHSRNSSGAESVSYARDDDGRWILERRRTGDDGELELIAREYLDPTRI